MILVRDHSDFKVKTCFSQKQLGDLIGTKVHMKAYGRMGMKIYINELGHMIKMAAMLIYRKTFKIFFSRTNGLMALEHGM